MGEMVRKQIYLERRQVKAVQRKAEVLGVNESELIRQAIDRDLYGWGSSVSSHPDPAVWDEIETFLTAQAAQPLSGEPYHFNRSEIYEERSEYLDGIDLD